MNKLGAIKQKRKNIGFLFEKFPPYTIQSSDILIQIKSVDLNIYFIELFFLTLTFNLDDCQRAPKYILYIYFTDSTMNKYGQNYIVKYNTKSSSQACSLHTPLLMTHLFNQNSYSIYLKLL